MASRDRFGNENLPPLRENEADRHETGITSRTTVPETRMGNVTGRYVSRRLPRTGSVANSTRIVLSGVPTKDRRDGPAWRCRMTLDRHRAGVAQWQSRSFPSLRRGFDSLHPLHRSRLSSLGTQPSGATQQDADKHRPEQRGGDVADRVVPSPVSVRNPIDALVRRFYGGDDQQRHRRAKAGAREPRGRQPEHETGIDVKKFVRPGGVRGQPHDGRFIGVDCVH